MKKFLALVYFAFSLTSFGSPPLCPLKTVYYPLDAETSLGFSANGLLSSIASNRQSSINWEDGNSSNVTLDFVPASDVASVVSQDGDNCVAYEVESRILIGGFLLMKTSDGKIDARWPATLSSTNISNAQVEFDLETNELQGLPEPSSWEFVPKTYLRFKFQSTQVDGIIYRIFGIPCDFIENECYTLSDALVATIGSGVPWFEPMTL